MEKLIFSLLVIISLQGCVSTHEEIQNKFEAGRQDELAEMERLRGNETMAQIHEDSARRNRNTTSFLSYVVEKIFE